MSTANAPNTQSQDATTGKQQQPGYLEQTYNLASNAANSATATTANAYNSVAGSTDNTGPTNSTTNYRSNQPHVGGVGDMGTKDDADVARLPEERVNPNPHTSQGISGSLQKPNISDSTTAPERSNAHNPPDPYPMSTVGVGNPSDKQRRNLEDHGEGIVDLGTNKDAGATRLPEERGNLDPHRNRNVGAAHLPEERADSDPVGSKPDERNPFRDTTTGAVAGLTTSQHPGRDTTDTTGTQSRDTRRGNRDEGSVGQHPHFSAGAMDFHSGRDAGYKADTRDQGVNEKVQAPVGVDSTSGPRHHEHRDEGQSVFDGRRAPMGTDAAGGHRLHDMRDEVKASHPPAGGDARSGYVRQGHRGEAEGRSGQQAQAPVGVPAMADTTSHNRHHDYRDEAEGRLKGDTQAPVGAPAISDSTSGSARPHHENRHEAGEPHHGNDTTHTSDKSGPTMKDKLHGKAMVAMGKLTRDPEAVAQGERVQAEGV